jgi:hypothetical protein
MTQEQYLNRFTQVASYMIGLTSKKNADYAGSEDAFKNFQLIETETSGRISTAAGILVRLTDKLQRFANLLARPAKVADESIEDTLLDNAVYSIIMYLWLTRDKKELTFPGQEDKAMAEEVAASIPEGASLNTEEDAYDALVNRVVEAGNNVMVLSPTERKYLAMLIEMKLGQAETITEGA